MRHYNIGHHITDEVLEEYSMHRLDHREEASVEEHLFACEACQAQLQEVEVYIFATKAALHSGSRKPAARAAQHRGSSVLQGWFTVPILAAAAAALIITFVFARHPDGKPLSPTEVRLVAMRGPETPVVRVRSGTKLVLDLEAEELAAGITYEVQVVNAHGAPVWSGKAARQGVDIRLTLNPPPASGTYWVRVYDRADLMREYGVHIQ